MIEVDIVFLDKQVETVSIHVLPLPNDVIDIDGSTWKVKRVEHKITTFSEESDFHKAVVHIKEF